MSDTTRDGVRQSNENVETSHHPETDPGREEKNYYGIPPIKHAHWTWQIPVYFWIGGIGAGVHLFSTMAQILGHRDAALIRASRYIREDIGARRSATEVPNQPPRSRRPVATPAPCVLSTLGALGGSWPARHRSGCRRSSLSVSMPRNGGGLELGHAVLRRISARSARGTAEPRPWLVVAKSARTRAGRA